MDETGEVRPLPRVARELSSWERRLFDGVRMVGADEQEEIAMSPRHRPVVIRGPSNGESQ